MFLDTNLRGLNMWVTGGGTANISFTNIPTTDIIVQYQAPAGAPSIISSAPKAPMAAKFPDGYTQIVSGVSFYWPNSTISFKNISGNTMTINTAQLENGIPGMPIPAGMTASGTQLYNLPVIGTLAPGESTSFKMPDLNPGVNIPGYGPVNYNFSRMFLDTNLRGLNMWVTGSGTANISFTNIPTTDIIVQYHP
jgi:hypothetical protein